MHMHPKWMATATGYDRANDDAFDGRLIGSLVFHLAWSLQLDRCIIICSPF